VDENERDENEQSKLASKHRTRIKSSPDERQQLRKKEGKKCVQEAMGKTAEVRSGDVHEEKRRRNS
jgi:hypothetical protein